MAVVLETIDLEIPELTGTFQSAQGLGSPSIEESRIHRLTHKKHQIT